MIDQSLILNAKKREVKGKEVRQVRAEGMTPAVLYGHDVDNVSLSIPTNELEKVFRQAGENTIIQLKIDDGQAVSVLIHDVQNHIAKGNITHADLYQVRMDEKITTTIPLEFIGESVAVKQLGGTLVPNLSEVEVESLPADIPHNIEIDISSLKTFDDLIRVEDLNVDKSKITILTEPDQLVVKVEEPRSEEELAELEEAPEEIKVEDIEGVEKEEGESGVDDEGRSGEVEESTDESKKEKKEEE